MVLCIQSLKTVSTAATGVWMFPRTDEAFLEEPIYCLACKNNIVLKLCSKKKYW